MDYKEMRYDLAKQLLLNQDSKSVKACVELADQMLKELAIPQEIDHETEEILFNEERDRIINYLCSTLLNSLLIKSIPSAYRMESYTMDKIALTSLLKRMPR